MVQPDLFNPPDDALAGEKIRMVMALRSAGIRDHRLLSALETVPRELFVPKMFQSRSYENVSLPISAGQTIHSPELIARMLEGLQVGERDMVLEVGFGSGYQTAILSQLARRVFAMDYHHELRGEAVSRLEQLALHNVICMIGDGYRGWRDTAPYDRIIVTAALRAMPTELLDQLNDGGVIVAPVGAYGQLQKVMRVTRDKWNFRTTILFEEQFDPMIGEPS